MLSKRTASGNSPSFSKAWKCLHESVRELGGNAKRHVGSQGGKKKEGSTVKLVDFLFVKVRGSMCVYVPGWVKDKVRGSKRSTAERLSEETKSTLNQLTEEEMERIRERQAVSDGFAH